MVLQWEGPDHHHDGLVSHFLLSLAVKFGDTKLGLFFTENVRGAALSLVAFQFLII